MLGLGGYGTGVAQDTHHLEEKGSRGTEDVRNLEN